MVGRLWGYQGLTVLPFKSSTLPVGGFPLRGEPHQSLPLRGDSPRCGEMAEGQKGRKVVSEANRMRWRRKGSCPNPAPSSVAYGDSLFCGAPSAFIPLARECAAGAFLFRAHPPGEAFDSLRRTTQTVPLRAKRTSHSPNRYTFIKK